MALNPVPTGDALARGMRSEFQNSLRAELGNAEGRVAPLMELGISSDKFEEIFGYYEQAPYPRRLPLGEEIQSGSFRARNYTVENLDWGLAIEWARNSRLFDQLGGLLDRVRDGGRNFATLPERVAFQLLLNGTDSNLLPAIPTCPDGATLFATTAGGSARFGVTGGNVVTGSGVATSDAVRADYHSTMARFAQFQDNQGEPLNTPDILDAGVHIFFTAGNIEVVREAFLQSRTLDGGAPLTNIVLEAGGKINLHPTSRIPSTNDDIFVVLESPRVKPMFQIVAEPIQEFVATIDNDRRSAETRIEKMIWSAVMGFSLNLPTGIIQINN